MSSIEIRGPSGLGDAIYVNSIANGFAQTYGKVIVRTKYPEVFKYCERVETVPFKKGGADKEFNYGGRRRADQSTTQWQDLLITSGVSENTPYKTKWEITNQKKVDIVLKASRGKKILLVSMPRPPFGSRLDKFGLDMIPNYKRFDYIIEQARGRGFFVVQSGRRNPLYDYNKIDLNLANKLTVPDTLDLGMICDMVLCQCGHMIPIAEGFDKPYFIIMARKGLNSNTEFIKNITGRKVCSKPKIGRTVIDDWNDELITQNFLEVMPK